MNFDVLGTHARSLVYKDVTAKSPHGFQCHDTFAYPKKREALARSKALYTRISPAKKGSTYLLFPHPLICGINGDGL